MSHHFKSKLDKKAKPSAQTKLEIRELQEVILLKRLRRLLYAGNRLLDEAILLKEFVLI